MPTNARINSELGDESTLSPSPIPSRLSRVAAGRHDHRSRRVIHDEEDEEGESVPPSREAVSQLADGVSDVGQELSQHVTADRGGEGGERQENEEGEGEEETPRKKQRLDGDGSAGPSLVKMDEKTEGKRKGKGREDLTRHEDGFLPGSIVRVALENFVTYDHVEFHPGPHLNMIIGPNGTGKSTVVCAIALGLGWSPKVLGRAKDISSFVKHGYQEGWIEIELKCFEGQSNLTVRRLINKDRNTSGWLINGHPSSKKDVDEHIRELNIQVGNLCSFLPQDKVAEFARMEPPELLKETQKAAGDEGLETWHKALIELGNEQRDLVGALAEDEREVANLQERNSVLERDVRRFEERQRIENEINLFKLMIPFAKYGAARRRYDSLKQEVKKLQQQLLNATKKEQPLASKLSELQGESQDLADRTKKVREEIDSVLKEMSRLSKNIESSEKHTNDLHRDLQGIKQRESERRKRIDSLRRDIQLLKSEVENEPDLQDTSEFDRSIRAVNEKLRRVADDREDVEREREEITATGRGHRRQKDRALTRLKELDNVKNQRLQALQKVDEVAFRAVQWIRENRGLFEGKIFEPAFIECSVKEQMMAGAVESCISLAYQKTFVCEKRKDYDLLTRELIDKKKYRINVAELESSAQLDDQLQAMNREQIQSFGFDGYVIDLIDGPEQVLNFLCTTTKLHLIPFSRKEQSVDVQAVEASRIFKRYLVANFNYTIAYSSYGKKLPQTTVREARPPKTFVRQVDQQMKIQLEQNLAEADAQIKELEKVVGKLHEKDMKLQEDADVLSKQRDAIHQEKRSIQQARATWERAKLNLETKTTALLREQDMPSADAERQKLARQLVKAAEKRSGLASSFAELMKDQLDLRARYDVLCLEGLQLMSKISALKSIRQKRQAKHDDVRRAVITAKNAFDKVKEEASALVNEAKHRLEGVDDNMRQQFSAFQADHAGRSVEDLEADLRELDAKLDLNQAAAPGVIDTYRKRKEEIENLQTKIAEKKRAIDKLNRRIDENRQKWLPALRTLVSAVGEKFSAAFDRIGCAGEIRISEDEDYDKWGINILVTFRDNERLQLLTGTRQSGGERSLSTILYLLSLTELSRAPFSLVDEINQGMDQRAERAVHNQMVEVTCRPGAGQYFLITPKLLPDLRYHAMMEVLVICNGEWLPEKFNWSAYVNARNKRLGRPITSKQAVAVG